jgi:DEAD/DEAH box helicase domain-containing protein
MSAEQAKKIRAAAPELSSLVERMLGLAEQSGFRIVDRAQFPSRDAEYVPVPERLEPTVRDLLQLTHPDGLYSHQAQAIEMALDGHDVCLATPTASGKSLVFMAATVDLLKRDPAAKALALYPAKALIHDQLEKWKHLLKSLDMRPGHIDGSVPSASRAAILENHRIVLMSPDVAHAWLMSNLRKPEIAAFLAALRLLILDEAHAYEGVFGTNMAYLLRRLEAVSGIQRVISSTATVGSPADFLEKLTGRRPRVFNPEDDRSTRPPKTVLLARAAEGKPFDRIVELLLNLGQADLGRFLAFGDSRKMVEQLVAAVSFSPGKEPGDQKEGPFPGGDEPESRPAGLGHLRVIPYRAGYEEEDSKAIQEALTSGDLAGIVSTSALEAGLDIGELNLVLLLGAPQSVKAFWQRVGRTGRRSEGVCLLIDDLGTIAGDPAGLQGYLRRPLEPCWLYLENQFIQYTHALCAALECTETCGVPFLQAAFASLPTEFLRFLENELNPTESVPDELYSLKQRAQAGPHREFPLRTGIEKTFNVRDPRESRLGSLSFPQALKEAYPGAIYYYMAAPYRVYEFRYRTGEILVRREKRWTTRPHLQNVVFPKCSGGILSLFRSETGFVAEMELQARERVVGFSEQRGPNTLNYEYGPESPYARHPVTRFFETTGICWYFPDANMLSETVAVAIKGAFCALCGVQEREIGVGTFHCNQSPIGAAHCQGLCVYDVTHGSLRLTRKLAERFSEVVDQALLIATAQDPVDRPLERNLALLRDAVGELLPASVSIPATASLMADNWATVIAPGGKGMLMDGGATQEVEVRAYRYTPQGLMYDLVPQYGNTTWMVKASNVFPINDVTKIFMVNLMTGEEKELAPAGEENATA